MDEHAVTRAGLGAWVLKCNPDVWDVVAFREDGGEWINVWSVGKTYRNSLMLPGDLVVFWVSGARPKDIQPGIWGVGRVISRVRPDVDTEAGYWRDLDAMRRSQWSLVVDIPLWEVPRPREELKVDPVLSTIEVLEMPRGSNPSYLTPEQWCALEPLLNGAVPAPPPTEVVDVDDLIEVPDVLTRVVIEEAAIGVVWKWLDEAGWEVEDRQTDNVGWDLTAVRGSETALVEVKGRFGSALDVLISPNEFKAAREHDNWELAVVTRALASEPSLDWFTAEDIRSTSTVALHRFRFDPDA